MKKFLIFIICLVMCFLSSTTVAGSITIESYNNSTDVLNISWDYTGDQIPFWIYADGNIIASNYMYTNYPITDYSTKKYTLIYISENEIFQTGNYSATVELQPEEYTKNITFESYFTSSVITMLVIITGLLIIAFYLHWFFGVISLLLSYWLLVDTFSITQDPKILIFNIVFTFACFIIMCINITTDKNGGR